MFRIFCLCECVCERECLGDFASVCVCECLGDFACGPTRPNQVDNLITRQHGDTDTFIKASLLWLVLYKTVLVKLKHLVDETNQQLAHG